MSDFQGNMLDDNLNENRIEAGEEGVMLHSSIIKIFGAYREAQPGDVNTMRENSVSTFRGKLWTGAMQLPDIKVSYEDGAAICTLSLTSDASNIFNNKLLPGIGEISIYPDGSVTYHPSLFERESGADVSAQANVAVKMFSEIFQALDFLKDEDSLKAKVEEEYPYKVDRSSIGSYWYWATRHCGNVVVSIAEGYGVKISEFIRIKL